MPCVAVVQAAPVAFDIARTLQAQEGRCFVLSSNQFARRCDYPADYATPFGDDPDTVLSRGGSCIIGPLGAILAGPDFEGEAILTAEIDRDDIARARMDFDAVGHYARPDIFQLNVDETARSPVAFGGTAAPVILASEPGTEH